MYGVRYGVYMLYVWCIYGVCMVYGMVYIWCMVWCIYGVCTVYGMVNGREQADPCQTSSGLSPGEIHAEANGATKRPPGTRRNPGKTRGPAHRTAKAGLLPRAGG